MMDYIFRLTFSRWILRADDKQKFSNFFKQISNSNFHCDIWVQDEKCFHINSIKSGDGTVVLEISTCFFRSNSKKNILIKTTARKVINKELENWGRKGSCKTWIMLRFVTLMKCIIYNLNLLLYCVKFAHEIMVILRLQVMQAVRKMS